MEMGVAAVNRGAKGNNYTLTNDASRMVGTVFVRNGNYDARDLYGASLDSGSYLAAEMRAAVTHFERWADSK